MKTKTQLGDRVSATVAESLSKASKLIGVKRQQLTEDAILLWMGKHDPIIESRRQMALSAFKRKELERPFNNWHGPLIPAVA